MRVNLRSRDLVRLVSMEPGSTFVMVGQRKNLYQVLDLYQTDAFRESPVLRSDLVYISEVETGIVSAMPNSTEVEEVEVELSEI